MARFPLSRLAVAVLGILHFIAAPCVMAMTVADPEAHCEHCPPGGDAMPCLTTAAGLAVTDVGPGPGRFSPAAPAAPVMVLQLPVAAAAMMPCRASPARRIAFATGRHSGDPPLSILHQKFRN
ncbi:MAG: hypothetical protein OEW88_06280 [Gammaproteobacteria bacterium]|nr:hypothetical protein [Gammaproteobacteria bacterium]